jgi:branched-subunit amino acid transport protein
MAVFEWFGCVTYALVGGLMFKAIFFATSELATVPLIDRGLAFAAGMAIFTLSKRSVGAGFVGGVAVFAGLALWRLGGV